MRERERKNHHDLRQTNYHSAGKSRKDINWQRQTLTVSELYDRLKTPARGVEALSEYTKLKKPSRTI